MKPVSRRYIDTREAALLLLRLPVIAVFALLVLVVLFGVFMRYLFQAQPGWTEELARFLLIWLSMLGAALAYARRAHLGIDVLHQKLDPAAGRWLSVIGHVLVLAFALWVMALGGADVVQRTMATGQVAPALQIRKGFVYVVTPVSGAAFVLLAIEGIVLNLRGRQLPEDVKPGAETGEAGAAAD